MFQLVIETIKNNLDYYLKENNYNIDSSFYDEIIADVIFDKKDENEIINEKIMKTKLLYQSCIIEINDTDCIEIPAYVKVKDLVFIILAYYNHKEGYPYLFSRNDNWFLGSYNLHLYDTLFMLGHVSKVTYNYKYTYKIVFKQFIKHEQKYTINHINQDIYTKYIDIKSTYLC